MHRVSSVDGDGKRTNERDDDGDDDELRSRKTKTGWWHCDQHPGVRKEFDCVQGLVNVGLPTSEETGGNVRDRNARLIVPIYTIRQSVSSTPVSSVLVQMC